MRILGKWNWYLPSWLEWLPDLRIEGTAPPAPVASPHAPTGGIDMGVGEVRPAGD
jgi:RND superfamily putative drug exporter